MDEQTDIDERGHRVEEPIRQELTPEVGGDAEFEFRYVEERRELEVVEPDGEATEAEIEEYEHAHPRVVGELYVRVADPPEPMPSERFFRLARFYSHDSYDGQFALVFEEFDVYRPGLRYIAELLEWSTDLRETLHRLGEFTDYPAPFAVPATRPDRFADWDEEPEEVEAPVEWKEPASVEADTADDDPDSLLVEAAEAIAAGENNDEWLDSYEAYPDDHGSKHPDSPNFARAYRLLAQADAIDDTGRSHALRGDWYAANEHRWRTVRRETAKCYERAVAAAPRNREFLEKCALAQQRSGAHASAVKTLNTLMRLEEEDSRWLYLRAVSFGKRGSCERAVKEFEKVVDARPDDPRGYLAALHSLKNQGKYDTAKEYATRAIELQPSALAYSSRAAIISYIVSYLRRPPKEGMISVAVHQSIANDYTQAIELADTPLAKWYDKRAEAHEKSGQPELAEKDRQMGDKLGEQARKDLYVRQGEWWAWIQAEEIKPPPIQ